MAIKVTLDLILVQRGVRLTELSEKTGISMQNLSVLKTNKAKAIRFSTLESICRVLNCSPGDLLEFETEKKNSKK